jgi:hypothetical protein
MELPKASGPFEWRLEGTPRNDRDAGAVILRPIETQPWVERSFLLHRPVW